MTSGSTFLRSTPEAQGIASKALLDFLDGVEDSGLALHSLMLLRHDHVVAEGWWHPYAPDRPHMLFSLSKSFTSTAIGLAVAEGRLSVDDFVLSFFADDAPTEVSENLAAMRVRHLLSMSTGHSEDTTDALSTHRDGNWVRDFLAQPVTYEPGTHFLYNSGATYMLSAIIQGLTGTTMLEYLRPRLLAPLGIVGATWETCPRGINTGGWGLSATTDAIARLGQLYLRGGRWQGRRLLPEAWVAEATSPQISNGSGPGSDWEQGYGYQFWRCRHGAYRGDGAFGQYCLVLPEQDAVLAITSGLTDMQAVLDLVWEHLLPAMGNAGIDEAASQDQLRRRLSGLAIAAPPGKPSSPTAGRVSGQTYHVDDNDQHIESLRLDVDGDETVLTIRDKRRGEQRIVCGAEDWHDGVIDLPDGRPVQQLEGAGPRPMTTRGTWVADDTYVITLCFCETPFIGTITCRFDDRRLIFDYRMNVSFSSTESPQLIGRLVA